MEVRSQEKPVPLVEISGEVDHYNVSTVRATIEELTHRNPRFLVIDFTETSYIDTAGVALLFRTAKELMQQNGELILVLPPGNVRRILEMAGIGQMPHTYLYTDRSSALAAAAS